MVEGQFVVSLDFDGVLAQGHEVKIRCAREWFGVDLTPEQTKKESFEALMRQLGKNVSYRDLMDPLNEQHIMEYEIPEGCIEALRRLQALGCCFPVITSRNDHDYEYALQFIGRYFDGVILSVHNTHNQPKRRFILDLGSMVHVDDDLSKLRELSGLDVNRVYFRQPENAHIPADGFLEAHSFLELEGIITRLKDECRIYGTNL